MTVTRPISFDTSGGGFPAALGGRAAAAAGGERPQTVRSPRPRQARHEVLARRLRRGPTQLPASDGLDDRRPGRRLRRGGRAHAQRDPRRGHRAAGDPAAAARSVFGGPGAGPQVVGPRNVDIDAITVSGVDQTSRELGAITPGQISSGRYFTDSDTREAVLDTAYASRKGIAVGETVKLGGSRSP